MLVNRKATAAAVASLAVAGALLAAAPAEAAPTPKGDGAKAICKRLPKTEERVAKSLERLNGDAGTVGSVARLEQRVNNAKTAGHTEIQTYLNDRLTFRKSLVTTLQTRQNDLKSVATWCGTQSASPSTGK